MIRVVSVLALLALASSSALLKAGASEDGQDPVKLEARLASSGETVEVEVSSALDLRTTLKDQSGTQERESSHARREKFTQQTTGEVDGTRTTRVTCSSSKVEHSSTSARARIDSTELEGRKFNVTRTAGRRTVWNEDGTPASTEADAVGSWEDYGRLLPKAAVNSGDTWTIADADLGGIISVGNLANSRTSLKGKVEKIEGDQATLSFTGTLSGLTHDGYDLKITNVDAQMVFDISKGRPVSFALKADLAASKKVTQGFIPPGGYRPRQEEIGEVKTESRRFDVSVTYK